VDNPAADVRLSFVTTDLGATATLQRRSAAGPWLTVPVTATAGSTEGSWQFDLVDATPGNSEYRVVLARGGILRYGSATPVTVPQPLAALVGVSVERAPRVGLDNPAYAVDASGTPNVLVRFQDTGQVGPATQYSVRRTASDPSTILGDPQVQVQLTGTAFLLVDAAAGQNIYAVTRDVTEYGQRVTGTSSVFPVPLPLRVTAPTVTAGQSLGNPAVSDLFATMSVLPVAGAFGDSVFTQQYTLERTPVAGRSAPAEGDVWSPFVADVSNGSLGVEPARFFTVTDPPRGDYFYRVRVNAVSTDGVDLGLSTVSGWQRLATWAAVQPITNVTTPLPSLLGVYLLTLTGPLVSIDPDQVFTYQVQWRVTGSGAEDGWSPWQNAVMTVNVLGQGLITATPETSAPFVQWRVRKIDPRGAYAVSPPSTLGL
jgi:hypothetical protein